ncbi:glycosyltransferase family 39 protein [Sphingomonas montanisoli]|uniref:Glycosyltransferase RgtA/B/C/D-like domain-containing protein n=1 Tax=Sphingomonas montanisoli TaxID=2606412 RepID=A0A5D9C8I2_9SPHN|nr:glycosyltransferase family 39 protein [Sphingomonas montanisoli]TZG26335.1 hypothetical protein FYJ91_15480 [Sphingomonas montanisoli]
MLSLRNRWLLVGFVILLFGIGVRAWGLTDEPMWLDEAYSAYAASKGWHFLWAVVPAYETHPPFYYSLLRGWTLIVGDGLLGHRSLGVVAGSIALPVVALAARDAARASGLADRAGLIAVSALAAASVSPVLVEMAREVRPYPLMIMAYALGIWALMRIAARGRLEGVPYAAYLACSALMLWLHNMGPLYAAAMGLALLVVAWPRTPRDWGWLVGGHAIVLLVWSPALVILLDQAPMWIKATWLKFSTANLWRRVTLIWTGNGDGLRAAVALLVLAALWRVRKVPAGRRIAGALLILAIFPVAVSLILSATVAPVFIIRTMTALAVPAMVLIGIGAGGYAGKVKWLLWAAAIYLLVDQGTADVDARIANRPQEDWYAAARWVGARAKPGDLVYAYPNESALPFDRAVRDLGLPLQTRPIPGEVPVLNPPPGSWYVSGSRGVPSLDQAHLRGIARDKVSRAAPTIWLVRGGPWAYDKGDVFVKELEAAGRLNTGHYYRFPIDIVGLQLNPPPPGGGGAEGDGGGGRRPQ